MNVRVHIESAVGLLANEKNPQSSEEPKVHKRHLAVLAALLVTASVLIVFASSFGSGRRYAGPTAPFVDTHTPVPPAISNLTAQGGQAAAASLLKPAANTLSANQLTVNYVGVITVAPSGGYLGWASLSSPIRASAYKYGNDVKLAANATDVPFMGPASLVYANLSSGSWVCTDFNMSALEHEDFAALLGGSRKVSCSGSGALPIGNLTAMLSGVLLYQGFTMNFSSEYQSSYNGTPCTYLAGTMERGGAQPANGTFGTCVSDKYYLPLTLAAVLDNGAGTVTISLNATEISTSSQLQDADSLPG
jgi:hypothetical protein